MRKLPRQPRRHCVRLKRTDRTTWGLAVMRNTDGSPRQPRRRALLILAMLVALFPVALLIAVLAWAEMTAAPAQQPGITPNPAKAPREFLSPQERLIYVGPYWAGVFVPVFSFVTLVSWGLAGVFLIAFWKSRSPAPGKDL